MTEQSSPTVVDVLRARFDQHSKPRARTDAFRVALAIEGGGNRSSFSAGMALAIDEAGLTECFDAVYGTSGGALNAAWLLTGDAQRFLPSWAWPEVAAKRITDPGRVLRGGSIVDTRVLVHEIYEHVTPMNFEAILANPITFHPIATDALTGEPADLHSAAKDKASLQATLRASTCMPLLAGRPIEVEGKTYLDGGLSEPVPFRSALAQGATHVLVLRTRRSNQKADAPSQAERLALGPYFAKYGPGAGRSYGERHIAYADDDVRLADPGTPHLVQVRPPDDAPNVGRLTGDLDLIRRAIEIGRTAMHSVWAS